MLRKYQSEAVEAVMRELSQERASTLLVAPTGSGKSHIIAEVVKRLFKDEGASILIVSHVREIISQNIDKLYRLNPGLPIAVYSAGFSQKRFGKITFSTVQTVCKKTDLPHFDYLIVDEAHLVPTSGFGQYRNLISNLQKKNPRLKILGLTATPFRLDSGVLFGRDEQLFRTVAWEIPMLELIVDGYLSPLVNKRGIKEIERASLKTSGRDYSMDSVNEQTSDDLIRSALKEVCSLGKKRKSWLIFCSSIAHVERVNKILSSEFKINSRAVVSSLPMARDILFNDFRQKKIQCLVGCEIFTTGFDAPSVDLIVLFRPTKSAGLFVQMLGRGMRIAEGKTDCLVLDYAGNVAEHGAIDQIRISRKKKSRDDWDDYELQKAPVKHCPECYFFNPARARECKECGYEFPESANPKHGTVASEEAILSIDPSWSEIRDYSLDWHEVKSGRTMLKMEFETYAMWRINLYLDFEGFGKLLAKSRAYWQAIINTEIPKTNEEAISRFIQERGAIRSIGYIQNGDFKEIVAIDRQTREEVEADNAWEFE